MLHSTCKRTDFVSTIPQTIDRNTCPISTVKHFHQFLFHSINDFLQNDEKIRRFEKREKERSTNHSSFFIGMTEIFVHDTMNDGNTQKISEWKTNARHFQRLIFSSSITFQYTPWDFLACVPKHCSSVQWSLCSPTILRHFSHRSFSSPRILVHKILELIENVQLNYTHRCNNIPKHDIRSERKGKRRRYARLNLLRSITNRMSG